MIAREAQAADFLARCGWADARRAPLAGDASNRRYERLQHPALGPAVLMDAPPCKDEDVRPFITVAVHLLALGLSAPKILARDEARGFLLLEDLGDDLFARVLEREPALEGQLYEAATDVLVLLHKALPPQALAVYTPDLMAEMAALAFDWYLPHTTGPDDAARHAFMAAFLPLLNAHQARQPVLIQRDYHAENLLWLPGRRGPARVGLLDFQDAMKGHPAYDLVSLLQDARRDVPEAVEAAMIGTYLSKSSMNRAEFEPAYHILGAQRNLRIIGVFARLCLRDGKADYVDLIPRVWGLLQRDLDHRALRPVAALLRASLPAPNTELLNRLKERCGTIPKP